MQDIRICFFGDSYTNGTGDETSLGWVGRAMSKTSAKYNTTYYNLGIRGNTSKDISNRWKKEADLRLKDCDAKYLVFSFGTNDTNFLNGKRVLQLEQTIENTKCIIEEATLYNNLLVIGPPTLCNEDHNDRNSELDKALEKLCREHDVAYISLYQRLDSNEKWLSLIAENDQYHPSSEGYKILSDVITSSAYWILK